MKSKRNRIFDEFGGTPQFPPEFKIGHSWEYVHIHPHPKRPKYYRVIVKRRGQEKECVGGSENKALLVPTVIGALIELEILPPTRPKRYRYGNIHGLVMWRLGFWATH